MKLYVAKYAPNPRRVLMFIAEKGIRDIEIATLDLAANEHRAPQFKLLSPLAQVPVLEFEDGRALTESRAICTYLESRYPEPNLMGRDGAERAFIEMWDRRAELTLALPVMGWVLNTHPAMARLGPQSSERAVVEQGRAMAAVQWFDRELRNRPWLAGDRFTIADITAACGLDFAKMVRWRPGDDLPNLRRWRTALDERPAGKTPV
jgi:glutathione S-transferase